MPYIFIKHEWEPDQDDEEGPTTVASISHVAPQLVGNVVQVIKVDRLDKVLMDVPVEDLMAELGRRVVDYEQYVNGGKAKPNKLDIRREANERRRTQLRRDVDKHEVGED